MDFEIAKEKAVRYLVVAKRTEKEVRDKLKKSKFENTVIDEVILYLTNLGYINDEEYVDAYVKQCMRLLNVSIFEMKQKLLQKGIKKYIIDSKLENIKETNYEQKLIKKLMDTKLKNMDELKKKMYLYRRGLKIENQYEDWEE